jgi:hypothetical protein
MSELTECNFCTLRGMKRRAKAQGKRVITLPGRLTDAGLPRGIDVYTVPPGVSKHDLKTRADLRERYGGSWFMALTDSCCC